MASPPSTPRRGNFSALPATTNGTCLVRAVEIPISVLPHHSSASSTHPPTHPRRHTHHKNTHTNRGPAAYGLDLWAIYNARTAAAAAPATTTRTAAIQFRSRPKTTSKTGGTPFFPFLYQRVRSFFLVMHVTCSDFCLLVHTHENRRRATRLARASLLPHPSRTKNARRKKKKTTRRTPPSPSTPPPPPTMTTTRPPSPTTTTPWALAA